MLKLAIALVAVAVILAGLLAGLPSRALDGTPSSPNVFPPMAPRLCLSRGIFADVFTWCADAPAAPVQRPEVTPEPKHTADVYYVPVAPELCWRPGMSRNIGIAERPCD